MNGRWWGLLVIIRSEKRRQEARSKKEVEIIK